MTKKSAFTLIELLIVIAIVGILAAIILVNTEESKKNGLDSAIIESLTQIKNAAELQFNQAYTYDDICDGSGNLNTTTNLAAKDFERVRDYVNQRNGTIVCRDTALGYVVASSLNKGGCWCVDYEGHSEKFNLSATQTSCGDVLTAGTIVCP